MGKALENNDCRLTLANTIFVDCKFRQGGEMLAFATLHLQSGTQNRDVLAHGVNNVVLETWRGKSTFPNEVKAWQRLRKYNSNGELTAGLLASIRSAYPRYNELCTPLEVLGDQVTLVFLQALLPDLNVLWLEKKLVWQELGYSSYVSWREAMSSVNPSPKNLPYSPVDSVKSLSLLFQSAKKGEARLNKFLPPEHPL